MRNILIAVILMFFCSCDFPYDHGGLKWSHASFEEMTWYDAIEYCEDLDGRLPTISELRGLIRNCPGTELGGSCRINDDCLSSVDCEYYKCAVCAYDYGDSGKYDYFGVGSSLWSSSVDSSDSDYAYLVFFDEASIGRNEKTDKHMVRCVK